MKCPLFTAAEIAHEPEFNPSSNDCLGGECAWWDTRHEQCNEVNKARFLQDIALALEAIKEKMPHAGQFLKQRR